MPSAARRRMSAPRQRYFLCQIFIMLFRLIFAAVSLFALFFVDV